MTPDLENRSGPGGLLSQVSRRRSRPLILVVDDHEPSVYLRSRLLRGHDFEVIEAHTGTKALECIAERHPDLVCLDVRLPDIDGFQICRAIKGDPSTSSIMVLQISATYVGFEKQIEGLNAGADTYLVEPVEPKLLIATVEALLRLQRAEEAVRRAASEWRATFDAMSEGVALLDAEGRIVKCNLAFTQTVRMHWQGLLSASITDVLAHGSLSGVLTQVRQNRAQQKIVLELDSRFYDVALQPMLGPAGEVLSIICIMSDITDARLAEESLRRQARLLDLARDSIIVRDLDGAITFWNQGAEQTYGWTKEEVLGRSSETLLGTQSTRPLKDIEAELLQYGYWEGELVHTRRDQRPVTVWSRWVLQTDQAGQHSVLEINTDVTPQKKAHDELMQLYQKAQQQEELLREKQEELVQTGKLATLGEMASGIAHEVNNPLNNVSLFIGNLLDRLGQGDVHPDALIDILGQAHEEVKRAARIVSHLRTFGIGRKMSHTPMSVHDLIKSALSRVQLERELTGVNIHLDVSLSSPIVQGDESQLEQAIASILANAVDAVSNAPRKDIRITTCVRGQAVEVQIEDTGAGIPVGLEQRIFDPFFTTKEVGEGTGLGLSIAYSIVKAHGGSIQVVSPPGRGATVTIVLPLAAD